MKKRVLIVGIALIVFLGIVALGLQQSFNASTEGKENASLETNCSADSDCVPASCCHPTQCVPLTQAPQCKDTICTQVCTPGSLDCGQGSCACINRKCQAVLK